MALLASLAAAAEAPRLVMPVDCELGRTCHIQQFVDRDPGPGATDFTCGTLSYDGHKGTDFRLPDRSAMGAGVRVLAAAEGVVRGYRDGMPDRVSPGRGAPGIAGRECGNGLLIEHAGGWTTQYCHLRRGSVAAVKGDRVAAGEAIGLIGLSGATEFPHLHLTLRDPEGRVVDPFDARPAGQSCRFDDTASLWADPAALPYRAGGALAAGFATAIPSYDAIKAGTATPAAIGTDAPALVVWAHFFGLREGDEIVVGLAGPEGRRLAAERHRMERDRATQYRAVGRRAAGPWPPGIYRGVAVLMRDGAPVDRIERSLRIGD